MFCSTDLYPQPKLEEVIQTNVVEGIFNKFSNGYMVIVNYDMQIFRFIICNDF